MPRGGFRVGAGRKPKPKTGVVLGMNRTRRDEFALPPAVRDQSPTQDPAVVQICEPPADVSEAVKLVWRVLAPLAVEARTLKPAKLPGFRELCLRWVYCATLDARIWELGGPAAHEADALLKRLEKWRPMLGNSLKEFSLTAFGKPEAAEKPKAAVNPWTMVGGK